MAELDIKEFVHDNVLLSGRIAWPSQSGPRPAVLVMHDAMGMGTLVQRKAIELAEAGYVALASDLYGPELYSGEEMVYGRLFMELQNNPEQLRDRIVKTFEMLRDLPEVDPTRMFAIGFCFGGQCVLELARSGADVKAVVSFHGLLTTKLPARRGEVKAKILTITGNKDPHVPAADVASFQAEMIAAEADWQVTVYGEGWHAFSDPDVGRRDDVPGVRYDPLLARLSWASATEFMAALDGEG